MSNSKIAKKRISITLGLCILSMIAAVMGWYPTNYEQLFTPLNWGIVIFAYCSLIFAIFLLFPNKKIPGEKCVSNLSFLHLTVTLGIACAFFSWCVDPSYIANTGTDRTPHAVIMMLYGPWEWLMFIPFLFVEVYEATNGLPKWLSTIKLYVSAIAMMLGISISLMAGCTTIPRILNSIWGIEISPFLMMLPIAALVGFSAVRGIQRGMRIFSNISMGIMYTIMAIFVVMGLGYGLIDNSFNLFKETYSNFFSWMSYSGSDLDKIVIFPYWLWGLTWIPIICTFVRRISSGRSFRNVILTMAIGTSLVCNLYAVISNTAFSIFGSGNGMELFSNYHILGILYILMLLMMFVCSADSTCFSLDEMISKGSKALISYRKLLWVFVMCVFVSVLLIAGSGSTDAIYGLSYITAPILIILGLISLGIITFRYFKSKQISKE